MSKYYIEEIDADWYDIQEFEEDFLVDNDNFALTISLGRYRGINEDMDIEYYEENGYIKHPIYVTDHSGLFFQFGTSGLCRFDSGVGGYFLLKEGLELDQYQYVVDSLTAFYNGWVKDIQLIEKEVCECCDAVVSEEIIDSVLCLTYEERQKAYDYLNKEINRYEEEDKNNK